MKKIVAGFVFFAFLGLGLAQADIGVKVTIPGVAGLLGVGPKSEIIITNLTPFYGTLVALNKKIATIAPGATAHDERSFEFDHAVLPVVVFFHPTQESARAFFRPTSQKEKEDAYDRLVGVAARTLSVTKGLSTDWEIQSADIVYPDGRLTYYYGGLGWGRSNPYPMPDIGEDVEVEFPRIKFRSVTAVQFLNVTYFDVIIKLNRRKTSELNPWGLYYAEMSTRLDRSASVKMKVIFSDRGRLKGYYDADFDVGRGDGPAGIQFVLDPSKIIPY